MTDLEGKIIQFFETLPVAVVYLFGSQAKEKFHPQSDVDIAVLYEVTAVPDVLSQIQIKQDLESLLKKDVDLVVMNRTNPILKHQIFKYGRLLLSKNKRLLNAFFSSSLMEYDDIKRVRFPIEQNLLGRRVYG